MYEVKLLTALRDIPLGGLRYFEEVSSTNDIALAWAQEDARDFSLVIANEQTTGRGRGGRGWQTPPDSALALSLLLLPKNRENQNISLLTGLGALALATTLEENYALKPEIKWPNDILIHGKKVAGILVEVSWIGDVAKAIVLGMGVNIHASAVPPEGELHFPATSLEEVLGKSVDRVEVLHGFLTALLKWRPLLGREEMVAAWGEKLAFRGKQVEITGGDGQVIHGRVLGLNQDGSLHLDTVESIHFGDVHLRPTQL
ncbi:MAG: biotin--[acetyl-CoA-carboxylase] ligase [Anaerolineales bacterium]|uniref:biotin--[biotin carboxyl-carrier protein] ligase n=1 Tax=Candidatus Desulfolinea nitratireducens TaxID=2841698 RepID=A0A8J6TGZ6_9CHLR|nr:biotin--[acetyl-CoA-carboxylase] ligase [Candidatus Desulfolinea nitratireducens]MBL6959594.1 biotin--[acetyl-CoA-carboxylase] ligase [Anaerolineales bacterium]